MRISLVELSNFRNHKQLLIDDIGPVLVIVGNNASGKTNIIEALQLLTMQESFRRPNPEELVYEATPTNQTSSITIHFEDNDTNNSKQLLLKDNTRTYLLNKKERPARELSDLLPAVLFTPDDLQIIKGPPEQRRDMIDSLGSRLSKSFAQIKVDYYRALRHKNSLLKQEEIDRDLLDSWNINLAKLGSSLNKHRQGLFQRLLEETAVAYTKISGGEELQGCYLALWEQYDSDLYEALLQIQAEEIAARRSLIGPQKDDLSFTINGHDARRFASQGQQRSLALAIKMAEIDILRRVSGKDPLLLLDDVMSELDTARRGCFVDLIEHSTQTIITTTNLGYFDADFLKRATIVELERNDNSGAGENEAGNHGGVGEN